MAPGRSSGPCSAASSTRSRSACCRASSRRATSCARRRRPRGARLSTRGAGKRMSPETGGPSPFQRRPTAAAAAPRAVAHLGDGVVFSRCSCSSTSSSSMLRDGKALEYSEFKSLLAAGPGRRGHDRRRTSIRGKYQDADNKQVAFTTVRVDDPKLVEQLEAQKVRFSASSQSRWLTESARLGAPARSLHRRRVDVLLPPDGRRRGRHHVVRAQPREDLRRRRRQGELRRRRGRRRGRGGAAGDRRVPEEPEEIHDARRPHSQGRAARRPAGHGQDAARARGRRRSARCRSSA